MTLNGGDLPIYYQLEYSPDNITFYSQAYDNISRLNQSHYPGTILTNVAFYRVRAKNLVGIADIPSGVLKVSLTPGNYSPNVCDINPTNITVCWSESSTTWGNGAYPTYYQLEWLNPISYGNSCTNVATSALNDQTNPSSSSTTKWKVVSPTSGTKFWSF